MKGSNPVTELCFIIVAYGEIIFLGPSWTFSSITTNGCLTMRSQVSLPQIYQRLAFRGPHIQQCDSQVRLNFVCFMLTFPSLRFPFYRSLCEVSLNFL